MMVTEEYLGTSRLFRRLKIGPHGQLVELYAASLVEVGLARHSAWRSLNLVSDLLSWISRSRSILAELDERMVGRYLRDRARKRVIQRGDRMALKRWLSVLRHAGTIAPPASSPITLQDQITVEFGNYLQKERGLAPGTIERRLPTIRQFLSEVCSATGDVGKINQSDVVRYVERHARDGSPRSGQMMCSSLRLFLRYLYHKGLNPILLAGWGVISK